jgi:hypothetical protein
MQITKTGVAEIQVVAGLLAEAEAVVVGLLAEADFLVLVEVLVVAEAADRGKK